MKVWVPPENRKREVGKPRVFFRLVFTQCGFLLNVVWVAWEFSNIDYAQLTMLSKI